MNEFKEALFKAMDKATMALLLVRMTGHQSLTLRFSCFMTMYF